MDKDFISTIAAVSRALNGVNVCGKQNLANLYGCIATLDELVASYSSERQSSEGGELTAPHGEEE